jgi:hypothetical protein
VKESLAKIFTHVCFSYGLRSCVSAWTQDRLFVLSTEMSAVVYAWELQLVGHVGCVSER